jgi:hypothetical protein
VRRGVLLLALAGALAPAAPARAASVKVMVVGSERVLREPTTVRLTPRTVRASGRRCVVGARTPLSALLGARLRVKVRDYGRCGRSPRDAGSLFVTHVGPDRNRGRNGWAYKVGRRAGTTSAADPSGPFGNGRPLRGGQRVLWFWCVLGPRDSCQRTLEVRPDRRRAARGAQVRVRVRGYDDRGRGVDIAGATVSLGGSRATTGGDGRAVVTMPSSRRARLTATAPGLVPAPPVQISRS